MRKIIIIILSVLIIISTVCCIYVKIPKSIEQKNINIYSENVEDDFIPVDEVEKEVGQGEINNKQVDTVDNSSSNFKKIVINEENKKTNTVNKSEPENKTIEVKQKVQKTEDKNNSEDKLIIKENTVTSPKEEKQETKDSVNDEIIITEEIEQVSEKYKVNEQMINTIKKVIQNNASESMQNYGYEIVVDSSITELTNQFTYTEQRVKDKIIWKSGIIKIYARDFYFDGQYVSTQCFII